MLDSYQAKVFHLLLRQLMISISCWPLLETGYGMLPSCKDSFSLVTGRIMKSQTVQNQLNQDSPYADNVNQCCICVDLDTPWDKYKVNYWTLRPDST
ncbi:hypothetical protein TNCV_1634101 [Trichonephila clavipes]|nr:hypothetical protein TNCV_1634101 [Trichonephila clavipes]